MKKRKSPLWLRWTKRIAGVVCLLVLIGGSLLGFAVMLEMRKAGDRMGGLEKKLDQIDSPATVIYARDGKTLLYRASSEYRRLIKDYHDIPKVVIDATLAAEDKRFFDHRGVDARAAFRSIFRNVKEGRQAEGASTITMQLSKRLFTSSDKSWQRKVEDVANAIEIERRVTKTQILKAYLNQVYYGEGAYGIRAAADVYFGKKDLNALTVAEAAMLARMVRRPSAENPFEDPEVAIRNRNLVLRIMRDEKMLTPELYEKAVAEKPKLRSRQFGSGERIYFAPYFTRYVLDQLKHDYPDVDLGVAGWTVVTTIDPELQEATEAAVKSIVARNRGRRVNSAAFVLLDESGQILAMQGNTDWERDEFNIVAQGGRQPGSSFKPFVYAAALSTGAIRPGDQISNEPYVLRDPRGRVIWSPQNANGKSGGTSSIPSAIANSRNLPAIHVTDKVTPAVAAQYCRDVFGFKSEILPVMSMALGTNDVSPLEMATGYSVFMLRGDRFTPYGIVQILDKDKSVFRNNSPKIVEHILDERVATYIDMCLRMVVTEGTGTRARVIKDARGKTGTTNEAKDAWFCGYTNNLLGIGWVGNIRYSSKGTPRYEPMSDRVFGGVVTSQMWVEVMKRAQGKRGVGVARKGSELIRDDIPAEADGARVQPDVKAPDETIPDEGTDPLIQKGDGTDPASGKAEPPVAEPPVTEPPKTEPRRNDPPVEEMVDVDICADTGLKATIYCPETVTRQYRRSDAPKRWCRKHSPQR